MVLRLNAAGNNYYYYYHHHLLLLLLQHHHHFSHWYVDCKTETNRFNDNIICSKFIRNTPFSTLTHSTTVVVQRCHINVGKIFWDQPRKYLPSTCAVQLKIKTSYHTRPNTFRTRWNCIFLYVMKCWRFKQSYRGHERLDSIITNKNISVFHLEEERWL